MGVTFAAAAFRVPSQRRRETPAATIAAGASRRRTKAAAERRRRWWSLCRDDDDEDGGGGAARPSSLGEFLEVERRFGDFYGAEDTETDTGRVLFADGRVLPPAVEASSPAADLCRFPVLITGICSGCVR